MNVRLILQERQNAIVIPAAALQTGTQGTFVYLLKRRATAVRQMPRGRRQEGTDKRLRRLMLTGEQQTEFLCRAQPVKVELTEGTQVILAAA